MNLFVFSLVLSCLKHWIHSLSWRERVKLLHVLLYFLSSKKNAEKLLLLLCLLNAVAKDRETNFLVSWLYVYD